MNHKIKELAEQATITIKDEYGHWINSQLDAEKFGELIVRECAEIANAGIDPAESHLIGIDILKHFGVEL